MRVYCPFVRTPSRSSTHARKDGGGVTQVYVVARSLGMAEVRESTPDQKPGPLLGTVRKRRQRARVAASEETAEAAGKANREKKQN